MQRILSHMRKSIKDYNMIEENNKKAKLEDEFPNFFETPSSNFIF